MTDQEVDNTTPAGSEAPSTIDDYIRELKAGVQERLDVDHYLALDGTLWRTETEGAGQHKQVTFYSAIATPTPDSGKAYAYTKAAGDPELVELHFICNGSSEKQLTVDGALNIVIGELTPLVDGTTIYENGSNVLAVQLDDDTLEYDATAKVRIKTAALPTEGDSNAESIESPILARGDYSGNGTSQDIETGLDILWAVLTRVADGTANLEIVRRNNSTWTVKNGEGTNYTGANQVSVESDGTITVGSNSTMNEVAANYGWVALGYRL